MELKGEFIKAYIDDTTTLINEMDLLLKKCNSIGSLSKENVDALFRIFHTIKASAAAIEDKKTVDVSYKIENVVSYLRKYGPDALPAADVIELMFNSEYFFRNQLIALKQSSFEQEAEQFEGKLSSFIEDKAITADEGASHMVSFEVFKPVCQNVIEMTSNDLGKKVELEFVGSSLYIDRQIISRLSPPLIQILRNAVDHGIESPEERIKKGKPETGIISITYGLEESTMFITVFNDGATLDLKKIIRKADALNILTKPRNQYKPEEVANLIMERGFTTKDKPGKHSGRGVGMDVLKSAASDLGGKVLVNTGVTDGFSITLTIPIDEKNLIAAIKENDQ